MKKTLFSFLAAGAMVLMVSCGGSGKSYPEHEIFGKVLAAQLEYHEQDSILKAERTDDNWKGNKEKHKELVEKLYKDVEQAKADIIGRDVPFEVAPESGFEVTYCKIEDVNKLGNIEVKAQFKVTDPEKAYVFGFTKNEMYVNFRFVDVDGNVIRDNMMLSFKLDKEGVAGAVGETIFNLTNHGKTARDFYRFGKVVFFTQKN